MRNNSKRKRILALITEELGKLNREYLSIGNFMERIMKNNRILAIGNAQHSPVTPSGGFPHFGEVRGEFILLRGSVPGPNKRLVDLRLPLYPRKQKVQAPKIVELNIGGKAVPFVAPSAQQQGGQPAAAANAPAK